MIIFVFFFLPRLLQLGVDIFYSILDATGGFNPVFFLPDFEGAFTAAKILLVVLAPVVTLWVCQRIEYLRLSSETDFVGAEHLCEGHDDSMQSYIDAAEERSAVQTKFAAQQSRQNLQ
ncbi:MAG: hypothetical protein RR011_05290 [Oscillospiraceae bacterium]